MTNIASHPERFGLRTVKDHDRIGGYEYDTIIIWARDSDGTYWAGHDSGCSCPVPFEDVTLADLEQVRTLADVAAYARRRDFWEEHDVAALLEGLRLDGLPPVVDGSVVGSEPALPGVVKALAAALVTDEEAEEMDAAATTAMYGPTEEIRQAAKDRAVELIGRVLAAQPERQQPPAATPVSALPVLYRRSS